MFFKDLPPLENHCIIKTTFQIDFSLIQNVSRETLAVYCLSHRIFQIFFI